MKNLSILSLAALSILVTAGASTASLLKCSAPQEGNPVRCQAMIDFQDRKGRMLGDAPKDPLATLPALENLQCSSSISQMNIKPKKIGHEKSSPKIEFFVLDLTSKDSFSQKNPFEVEHTLNCTFMDQSTKYQITLDLTNVLLRQDKNGKDSIDLLFDTKWEKLTQANSFTQTQDESSTNKKA